MVAVIGSGKRVITAQTIAYEYNLKTHALTLLHEDLSRTVIDTKKDKVTIKNGTVIVDTFRGGKDVKSTNRMAKHR